MKPTLTEAIDEYRLYCIAAEKAHNLAMEEAKTALLAEYSLFKVGDKVSVDTDPKGLYYITDINMPFSRILYNLIAAKKDGSLPVRGRRRFYISPDKLKHHAKPSKSCGGVRVWTRQRADRTP